MNTYRVGTFQDGKRFSAYLRYYDFRWKNCVEFDVEAENGQKAKRKAIKLRKQMEFKNVKD